MLDIESPVEYSEIITGMEYHSHRPYASASYKNSDEIRIPISQPDLITAPFESTLHITGKVSGKKQDGTKASVKLVNNAVAFLFEDIRYEIGGIEVDRTKNLGIATTMKNILSIREEEKVNLENACWFGPGESKEISEFSFSIPLRLLLGFAEDYRRIIVNVKQELVLLRSATDVNAVVSSDAHEVVVEIQNVHWRVPHVTVSDGLRLKLLRMVEKDATIGIPFRNWELHEYPKLPETTLQSWTIKTSSQLEKPRYVVVAFQDDRKNKISKDMSSFDGCKIQNIKLYLNSQYYPYDKQNGDVTLFYENFARFQSSYYGQKTRWPSVTLAKFKENATLYVIDCSHQNDSIKSGPVDIRLEFEASENFSKTATAYCLLLHDSHVSYSLFTGTVKKVM